MKPIGIIIQVVPLLLASANLNATANSPVQRIDVANLLWNNVIGGNGGSTKVAVIADFANGGSIPCFSTTLASQGSITVWAGQGQPCTTAITSVTITPLDSPSGLGTVYQAPPDTPINTSLYSTQLSVIQNTAPVFDPENGALISPGTSTTTTVGH